MNKKAFNKIAGGLNEALAVARKTKTKPIVAEQDVVRVNFTTFTHPDAVRIEIEIGGADETTRDRVASAIKLAVDELTGGVR